MKEKLTRNIGLKVLSIILAVILWLVIINVDDPIKTKSFYNVPVTIYHANELKKLGQVYEIIEGKNVDITISTRRTIWENITSSDFTVTADFDYLSELDTVTIKISCPRYGDRVTITNVSNQVMKIVREDVAEDRFSVNVRIKGEPADGYYVYDKLVKRILSVSGPKSKIDKINQIIVEVDVTGASRTFEIDEKPKAIDDGGNEIENLEFGVDAVTAEIKMYPTKIIDLIIIPTGKPANGYLMTSPDFEPKTIEVAGTKDTLSNNDEFVIEENIDGATESIEKVVNIAEKLPEGLILVGDTQTASIDIPIVTAETKEILIWPEDIEIRNKPDNIDVVIQNVGPISAKITGPTDEMKNLTVKSIKPYIDLESYSSGSYEIALGMSLADFVTIEKSPTIRVNLNY